jgi:hypothetical protein
MMAAETASAVTLKREQGQTEQILRDDIDELVAAGRSLMPEGLENDLKPTDLADLLAYLAGGVDRPKRFPGNHPQTIAQAGDGTIRLDAARAAILGPTLNYVEEQASLESWQSGDDRASWEFQVDRPATFTITLEWSCAEESAGNDYELRVGPRTIKGTVGSTGSWTRYQTIFVGEVTLAVGKERLELRPGGAPRGALLDLRALVLTPRSPAVFKVPTPR